MFTGYGMEDQCSPHVPPSGALHTGTEPLHAILPSPTGNVQQEVLGNGCHFYGI